MPFYPPLGPLQPAQTNMLGAVSAGYGLGAGIEQNMRQNALAQRAEEEYQVKKNALSKYAETGDPNVFRATDPERAFNIEGLEGKRRKTAMDYAYYMVDQVKANPSIYPQTRAKLIQLGMPAEGIPEKYDEAAIDKFKTNYERMHKIQPELVPVMRPDGTFTGQYAPKGTIQLKPHETPAEKDERARGLVGYKEDLYRGRPEKPEKPSFDEKAYQEELTKRPELTRLQYLGEKARTGAEGRVEAKPLSDEEVRRINRYERKAKAGTINDVERKELKRLKGKQGGGTTEPTGDFYGSFKNTLSGPNKDAAIKRSQELKDGYYERAKGEGLIP